MQETLPINELWNIQQNRTSKCVLWNYRNCNSYIWHFYLVDRHVFSAKKRKWNHENFWKLIDFDLFWKLFEIVYFAQFNCAIILQTACHTIECTLRLSLPVCILNSSNFIFHKTTKEKHFEAYTWIWVAS